VIRLFAAIAVPAAQAQWLQRLKDGTLAERWSPPQNLHVTLRFAGDIGERQADDLDAELESIPGAPFDLTLRGVGAFESRGVPNAVWAGVEPSEALTTLQRRCESAARRAGLAPDPRAWRPHVTLAYLTGAEPWRVAAWIQQNNLARLEPFEIAQFGLYSSWRSKEGAVYRLERAYPLVSRRRRGP
jgi:2'-5' RNA ligase